MLKEIDLISGETKNMYYGEIKNSDIADGPGIRVSLFVSGCRNRCRGCFQPETWDFSFGQPYTEETEKKILELLKPPHVDGLTLLGGDPFEPENQGELLELLKKVRNLYPEKNVWAYTGYEFETLTAGMEHPCCEYTAEMLSLVDVLVDGKYVEELKSIALQFRGSSNQRLIDVRKSLESGEIVLFNVRKRASFYE